LLDIFELTNVLQPGCSSFEGLLQENAPFLWQYGTFKPVPNPYTWVNLTNVVWVEQPVGTGFSQGIPTATNEEDVAAQFLGFWENFVDIFALQGRKVYITGESYAGYYVNNTDTSPPSGVSVLPGVMERSKRTVIGHGVSYLSPNSQLLVYLLTHAWKGS
jgi:hypothetical protein